MTPSRQIEPQFGRQVAPAAMQASPVPAAQPEAPRQADLGFVPAVERPVQSRPQDDLLDIPAFLRRQAN